jgi:MoaA/NifB/PqqE/SkfB family radical SAM enzyme
MVDDLAKFGSPVLLISGGEPLTRPDLEDLAARAIGNGMRIVISSNGTLMTAERAERLAKIGISYVGLSIDGKPKTHDKFRGMKGAFDATMNAIRYCQDAGIKTGLSLTRAHESGSEITTVGPVARLSGTPVAAGRPAVSPGADGLTILEALGLGEEFAALIEAADAPAPVAGDD